MARIEEISVKNYRVMQNITLKDIKPALRIGRALLMYEERYWGIYTIHCSPWKTCLFRGERN